MSDKQKPIVCVSCNRKIVDHTDAGTVTMQTEFYGHPFQASANVCSQECVSKAVRSFADQFDKAHNSARSAILKGNN